MLRVITNSEVLSLFAILDTSFNWFLFALKLNRDKPQFFDNRLPVR